MLCRHAGRAAPTAPRPSDLRWRGGREGVRGVVVLERGRGLGERADTLCFYLTEYEVLGWFFSPNSAWEIYAAFGVFNFPGARPHQRDRIVLIEYQISGIKQACQLATCSYPLSFRLHSGSSVHFLPGRSASNMVFQDKSRWAARPGPREPCRKEEEELVMFGEAGNCGLRQ